MIDEINNNKFYNTFTPFIEPNTKTAEKTLCNDTILKNKNTTPQGIEKYLLPSGFLLFPIIAILVSKSHLKRILSNIDKEYFLAVNNELQGGFMNGISKKIIIAKYNLIQGINNFISPFKKQKDYIFLKITNPDNKSFFSSCLQRINNYFIQNKIAAANRNKEHIKRSLEKLISNLEEQLKKIESSKHGQIKVLLPDEILTCSAGNMPRTVDFSKTLGKDRCNEIRKLLSEIKRILNTKDVNYEKILPQITYSCEDVFNTGTEILINLRKELVKNNNLNPEQSELIKSLYDGLVKYKFAEIIPEKEIFASDELRRIHVQKLKENFELLKRKLPNNERIIEFTEMFEKLLTDKTNPENMGLLERIRILLKCNDYKRDITIKKEHKPSLLKHYQPDEYLLTKEYINDFARELKRLVTTEKYILPNTIDEINKGKIYTHTLAGLVPAGILATECYTDKKNKNKHKKTMGAFLIGTGTMFASHYFAICSRRISILYGLCATLLSANLIDKTTK